MNIQERRTEILKQYHAGNTLTTDLAKRYQVSVNTILADRNNLKKIGLIEKSGKSINMVTQLTREGLEYINEDPKQYKPLKEVVPRDRKANNGVKVKDRRMSVLAYLTFDINQSQSGIAKIVGTSQVTIGTDLKTLTKEKFLKKFAGIYSLTKKGLEAIDSYDGNYGRGRIKATK